MRRFDWGLRGQPEDTRRRLLSTTWPEAMAEAAREVRAQEWPGGVGHFEVCLLHCHGEEPWRTETRQGFVETTLGGPFRDF